MFTCPNSRIVLGFFFQSAHIEYKRNLCSNPLALLVVSLSPAIGQWYMLSTVMRIKIAYFFAWYNSIQKGYGKIAVSNVIQGVTTTNTYDIWRIEIISKFELESQRPSSWIKSKIKVTQGKHHIIDSYPFHFKSIRPSILEIQIFQDSNLKISNPMSR